MRWLAAIALLLAGCVFSASAEQLVLSTSSLAKWEVLSLPLNKRQTSYTAAEVPGGPAIEIETNNSNSSLVYDRVFKTYETPLLHWSWKVTNLLAKGNAETKEGDDYAVRIYVMFPYEQSHLSPIERLQFELGKRVLGYYPPSEVLNWAWANRLHARTPLPNAYSDRGMMFFPDAGTAHLGEWRTHTVNIVEAYRRAFKSDPSGSYRVAIMGDSDDTHGRTRAYIRDIWVGSN